MYWIISGGWPQFRAVGPKEIRLTNDNARDPIRGRSRFTPHDAADSQSDSLDGVVQAHIGRELRAMFDGIAKEPVPDRFLQLLQKLDAQRDTNPKHGHKEDRA